MPTHTTATRWKPWVTLTQTQTQVYVCVHKRMAHTKVASAECSKALEDSRARGERGDLRFRKTINCGKRCLSFTQICIWGQVGVLACECVRECECVRACCGFVCPITRNARWETWFLTGKLNGGSHDYKRVGMSGLHMLEMKWDFPVDTTARTNTHSHTNTHAHNCACGTNTDSWEILNLNANMWDYYDSLLPLAVFPVSLFVSASVRQVCVWTSVRVCVLQSFARCCCCDKY